MSTISQAHQEQDRGKRCVLHFFAAVMIVINAQINRQEALQTRIPAPENLYEVKFKMKGAVQKNDSHCIQY